MSTAVKSDPRPPDSSPSSGPRSPRTSPMSEGANRWIALGAIVFVVLTVLKVIGAFPSDLFGTYLSAFYTVVAGVAAAYALYFVLNFLAELMPEKWEERFKPIFFVLPAVAVIVVYLVYPAILTLWYSFLNSSETKIVGLQNYSDLFKDPDFRQTLLNTLLWIVIAPAATIILGLLVATLADRLSPRGEKFSKTLIFLPMAVGAVGAGTIWQFVYSPPQNGNQIGLQNAVWTKLGGSSQNWLQLQNYHFNTLLLIVVFLWGQIGYSMVLLSAAVKGVPADTLEAARIDGANEVQIFFRVIVPQIKVTIITVFITVLIGTLKVFDVIWVLTGGDANTNVIGVAFWTYHSQFPAQNGLASAVVVLLVVAVSPVMYYQVRQFRLQEANR